MHMVEQTQRSVIWVTLAILIGPNGISFFNFVVERLPLVEIAGRSLAVMSGEGMTLKVREGIEVRNGTEDACI